MFGVRGWTAVASVLGSVALAAPAQAALTAAGAVDPATKAPAFYQDANGLQLGLCQTGTVNCGPAVPGENFWYSAVSTMIGPAGATGRLILNVTQSTNAINTPIAFSRVRVELKSWPDGTYTITHPFGTMTVTVAGGTGKLTTDVGCNVADTVACNFAGALGGAIGPFLTAAPGSPAAPAGFIGDGATAVSVTGSPAGNNFFRVEGGSLPVGGIQENTFVLVGKLFGGVVPAFASSGSGAFANQLMQSTSAAKTITVTSSGIPGAGSNLTLGAVTVGGANAADFAIASNTCTGTTMASGASCTVGVTFTPSVAASRSATLTFADNTVAASHAVALSGTGIVPAPVIVPIAPAVVTPAPVLTPVTVAHPVTLTLGRLYVTSRITRARVRNHGVRLAMTLRDGTSALRVRVTRADGVVLETLRLAPSQVGAYSAKLDDAALRHKLKVGRYQVLVTPLDASGVAGTTARYAFSVVR
jgi:hypothetical protein